MKPHFKLVLAATAAIAVSALAQVSDPVQALKQINEESIHQHNAFAERTAKMGELRAELAGVKGN